MYRHINNQQPQQTIKYKPYGLFLSVIVEISSEMVVSISSNGRQISIRIIVAIAYINYEPSSIQYAQQPSVIESRDDLKIACCWCILQLSLSRPFNHRPDRPKLMKLNDIYLRVSRRNCSPWSGMYGGFKKISSELLLYHKTKRLLSALEARRGRWNDPRILNWPNIYYR